MRPSRTYKLIIEWVDARGNKPFAVWECAEELHISRSSVLRLFLKLKDMEYLAKRKRAYASRFWETTSNWIEFTDIIQNYEIAMAMKTNLRDIS